MSTTNTEQIANLRNAISTLDAQRAILGDSVVEASIMALKKELAEMEVKLSTPAQQRKLATVLKCDIVGHTSIIRNFDPEENVEIINRALLQLSKPIKFFGGRVTRFEGDGFKAVFGHPITHENDPELAVRAGLGILEETEKYAAKLKTDWGIERFTVRVGIDTGLVVVGGYSEAEDTVKETPVNLAARLESAATPGSVFISSSTFEHVQV